MDLKEADKIKNGGKNTQNYTKKFIMTWITMMVWSLPRARHPGVWIQMSYKKHDHK